MNSEPTALFVEVALVSAGLEGLDGEPEAELEHLGPVIPRNNLQQLDHVASTPTSLSLCGITLIYFRDIV